jgi:hypothetical protein
VRPAAVLLDRSLRLSEHETALEVGWLLAELERRFDYGLDELARLSQLNAFLGVFRGFARDKSLHCNKRF